MWKTPNKYIATIVIFITILELLAIAAIRINYVPQQPTVTAQATGIVQLSIQSPCSVPLKQGWNLISLCGNSSDKSVNAVLAGTGFQYVLRWNQSNQAFDIFSTQASSNPFTNLEENTSYFVFIPGSNNTLFISGNEFGDMNISLSQGWNGVGFPYIFSANTSKYIDPIPTLIYVLKWNATSQSYLIFSKNAATNPFSRIFAGEGQLLHTTASATLRYNKTELANS